VVPTVINKALSGPGASQPPLRITGVPAGELVVISGMIVFTLQAGAASAVEVSECAGTVWLQDVFVDSFGGPSLIATGAASLVLTNTMLQTNLTPALPDGTPQPGAGGEVHGGTALYAYDTDALGSHGVLQNGGLPVPTMPATGGPGFVVIDATVSWTGGVIRAGGGNSFFTGTCQVGGNGGDGLVVRDGPGSTAPQVSLHGVAVIAGAGGFFNPGCAPAPVPGAAFNVLPGSLTHTPGPGRELILPGLGAAGGTVSLGLKGAPGDAAFLLVSLAASPGFVAAQVDLHLALDKVVAVVPFALPAGALNAPVGLPALPAGLETLVVPLQALFVDAAGGRHASNPRALVIH
jgi:hypothetical protein